MARTSSYYLYERYEKRGDQDWIPSYPNVYSKDGDGTMPLVVRIARDYDCGWHCDPEYDWVDVPITEDYLCDECGEYGAVTHKWEAGSGYTCVGTTKYQELRLNVNVGNGWEEVYPAIIKPGNVLEEKSVDCGYEYPRLIAIMDDNTVKEVPYLCGYYETERTCTLEQVDMSEYGVSIPQVKQADFYHGHNIDRCLFAGCSTLTSATFHSAEEIEHFCFYGTGLKTVSGKVDDIESFAFASCKSLTSFTETSDKWHDAITGVGHFANCTGLTNIDISKLRGGGTYMFGNCTSLRTAKISISNQGAGYGKIPMACFDNCTGLTDVDVYCGFENEGLKYGDHEVWIRERAFCGCKSLSGITLAKHDYSAIIQPYYGDPFYGEDTYIGLGHIEKFAFYGCEKLPVNVLEDKLGEYCDMGSYSEMPPVEYSYSDGAFAGCKAFTHMPVPQYTSRLISDPLGSVHEKVEVVSISSDTYVTSVGNYTFSGCTGLQSLSFTSGLTSIGAHAFDGCTGLTSITFSGETPPSIGNNAFKNTNNCTIYVPCSKILDYIIALNQNQTEDDYSTRVHGIPPCGSPSYARKLQLMYSNGDVVNVYDSGSTFTLTSNDVKDHSASYTLITAATINDNVTIIGNSAFGNCSGLTSIVIPDNTTTIRGDAFVRCYNLTDVVVGSGVTDIGSYAFYSCSSLARITFKSTNPPHLNEASLPKYDGMVIYVPAESVNAYKSWDSGRYSDIIFPIT